MKKPVTRRASVSAKDGARKGSTAAALVGKNASETVEWPVDAQKSAKKPAPKKSVAGSSKIAVPPKAPPVTRSTSAPVAAKAAAQPVVVTPTVSPVAQASPPISAPVVTPVTVGSAKKGPFIMTDAMETAKTYAEEAKTRVQSAVAEMNEKAKVAMEKSAKAIEEFGELTKGNFDAIVESSRIAAKGVETMSQEAVEFGRRSFEKSSSTFKSFAAVKTPAEFFQLHSELVSATLDSFASEAARNSETVLKLVGDVSKPISNRVAIVSEKVKSLAA